VSGLGRPLVAFLSVLRRCGLPAGQEQAALAAQALTLINVGDRAQFHAALRAILLRRHDDAALFDLAFDQFWRQPAPAGSITAQDTATLSRPRPLERRLAEALGNVQAASISTATPDTQQDATGSATALERLRALDFEAMGAAQLARAQRLMQRLPLRLPERRTRRYQPSRTSGAIDPARTIRASLRTGGEIVSLVRKTRITQPPPLVVLCDISGSMSRYAQVLLHFLHGLAQENRRFSLFLFGTRLTNVSRAIRHRDAEIALSRLSAAVTDFSGGTRIGEALALFNRLWARRILGGGATVLLITDGLERTDTAELSAAMTRLRRNARRIVWLNPLLRYGNFAPKARGVRAILPHVDELRPVHNLNSLDQLARALQSPAPARRPADLFRSAT
jgi:uncharacterized protein with von Willebrand factor type A (vWA) domain